MLNAFFALVLPGAANGMSIFILKGFFDSLPQELFEAATIDGATEAQIFRIAAMPLVKPILAINSLGAFIHAYNGWQWALIVCQDRRMWTIAVWLYQATDFRLFTFRVNVQIPRSILLPFPSAKDYAHNTVARLLNQPPQILKRSATMRLYVKSLVCLGLSTLLIALSGCESSDEDGATVGANTLPGSWAWSTIAITAPQLPDAVTVTPAALDALGHSLSLNMTAAEPDTFAATAIVPDLSGLKPFALGLGITIPDSLLALKGTHNISGSWNASNITAVVPAGTFVLPYTVSGNTLTVNIPAAMIEAIIGNAGVSLVITLTRI